MVICAGECVEACAMKMTGFALFAAAMTVVTPGIAAAQSPRIGLATTLRQMDAGFVCPQFLPSDEARRMEISTFARTLAAKGVSFAQATEIRAHFLTRHNCNASMASVDAVAQPASEAMTPIAVAAKGVPQ